MRRLLLISCGVALTMAVGAADAQSYRTIVRQGDQVPGLDPGMTFLNFGGISSGVGREFYFTSAITGNGANGAEDQVLVRSTPEGLTLIAREGRNTAGGTDGITFGGFSSVSINAAGKIAFLSGDANGSAVWTTAGGALTRLAATGQFAPGTNGARFSGFSRPVIGGHGLVAFHARLDGTATAPTSDGGVWVGVTTPTLIARVGGPAPDGVYTSIDSSSVRISDNDTVVFGARMTSASMVDRYAIVRYRDGQAVNLVSSGDLVTHFSGEEFTRVARPTLDWRDRLTFSGSTRRIGVPYDERAGYWLLQDGQYTPIALHHAPVPSMPPGVTFLDLRRPLLAGDDSYTFVTTVLGTGASTLPLGFKGEKQLFALWAQAPGAEPGLRLMSITPTASRENPTNVNRRGQVLMWGSIGTSSTSSVGAVWLTDANDEMKVLYRSGTVMDVDPGPAVNMQPTSSQPWGASGLCAGDGGPAALNELGEVPLLLGSGGAYILVMASLPTMCDTLDFNRNGVSPEDQDLIDFFNVFAGSPCWTCGDLDFNNDFVSNDEDVIDFLGVLAGSACP